jgi:hypothetical protein
VGRALVLDAGALIALEKGDVRLAGLVETCLDFGLPIVVPASVLAQVWRGGARMSRVSRALAAAAIDPLDEERAKEAGLRLGAQGASDVADAHVVCCTVELRATAVTSDADDLRALAEPGEPLALIAV